MRLSCENIRAFINIVEFKNVGSAGFTKLMFKRTVKKVNVVLTKAVVAPQFKVPFFKGNRLSLKKLLQGIAHSRHYFPKAPGYILPGLCSTLELNLLAIKTASDFQKFCLFNFMKCIEPKFQSDGYERRQSNLHKYFEKYPIKY